MGIMYFVDVALEKLKSNLEKILPDQDISIKETTDSRFGDFYTNIAFILSKKLNKNPHQLANEIIEKLNILEFSTSVEKGFINFRLRPEIFVDKVIEQVLKIKHYGFYNKGNGRLIIIEHTSANPNKPLHLGHIRCSVIGDSLVRLYKLLGYNVDVQFYVNDLGRQVAESFYGWKYLNKMTIKKEKFDWFLGEIYTYVHNNIDDETINKTLEKIENIESKEYIDLRKMVELCLSCQLDSLKKLDISFNRLVFESDIVRSSIFNETKKLLEEKGYLIHISENSKIKIKKQGKYVEPIKYNGCYILRLGEDFDDLVFIRSNGVATYIARDIAYALWKTGIIKNKIKFVNKNGTLFSNIEGEDFVIKELDFVISVIANEQEHAQNIVKKTIGFIDSEKKEKYIHIPFGLVQRKDVKLSSRKGTWKGFTVYDIFELLNHVLMESIQEKTKRESVVSSVIRYELLKYEQKENIKIDPKEMTDINGNTAIYLLYSYVRARNILNKFGDFKPLSKIYNEIKNEKEGIEIIKKFLFLPIIVNKCLNENSVKPICDYLFELCKLFNQWYRLYPVVKEKSIPRATIVLCFKKILEILFYVIGIRPVDRL